MWYDISPNVTNVVGLSGKAGSGKNTLAWQCLTSDGYTPIALATHFKVEALVESDYDPEEIVGSVERSEEVRSYLQEQGTELGRLVRGEDIWCKHTEALMKIMYEDGVTNFVVPDVRFPNEVEWIQSLGGVVFRVTGREDHESEKTANHASETSLDDYSGFDGWVDNSGSLRHAQEDLRHLVDLYEEDGPEPRPIRTRSGRVMDREKPPKRLSSLVSSLRSMSTSKSDGPVARGREII